MTISKMSSTGSIVRQSGSHSCTLLVSIAIRRPLTFSSRISSIIGSFRSSAPQKNPPERGSSGPHADRRLEAVAEDLEELRFGDVAALELEQRVLAVAGLLGRAHRLAEVLG